MTREEKMNNRREAGKTCTYKPNPFKKGTWEYRMEARKRAEKNVSHKTPFARWISIMAKLENQLEADRKATKEKKEVKKSKTNIPKQ